MKKLFLLISVFVPLFTYAQDAFNIKGHAGNLNAPAQVFLFYQLGANKVLDSSIVVNGDFAFMGNLNNPTNAYLVIDHKGAGAAKLGQTPDLLSFFLDKGEMRVTTADSISKAKITGSVINDESLKLNAQINPVMQEAARLNAEMQAVPKAKLNSEAYQVEMQGKFKELQAKQRSIMQTFIVTHPNSYLSLLALNSIDNKTDPVEAESLFNALSPAVKETEAGKIIKAAIDKSKVTAIGAMAPEFTQNDINGLPVKLSSFKGKYVLIDFWASWCGPCREENPNVVRVYNKYKTKNFTVLGVSLDKPGAKADWLAAIKSDGLTWTQVSDFKFWENDAAKLYGISAIPGNFLLDPKGKIIARDLRGPDLEKKLAEVIGL